MKKTTVIFSLLLLTSLFYIKAQESLGLTHRHELNVNLGSSLFLYFPEVSYEYILTEDITLGAAVGYGFNLNGNGGLNFKTTPFARWFFSSKDRQPATGYFLEANGLMGSQDVYKYNSSINRQMKDYSHFAVGLGLAAGWKYLSKSNWTAELFAGFGYSFIYDHTHSNPLCPRIGISVGKRF